MKLVDEMTGSEQCPVCGDKVSGYHYGLLTCESCKGTLYIPLVRQFYLSFVFVVVNVGCVTVAC